MKIVTSEQMRDLERIAIEDCKIPSILLMENAAAGFCLALMRIVELAGKKISVFCGRGNNGGDGFAIARHLSNMGLDVSCVIGFNAENAENLLTPDSYTNYRIAVNMGIPIIPFECIIEKYDVIIDALLGTGLKGAPRKPESDMIRAINESDAYVVSVDIPSGADASTGNIYDDCVCAFYTITFCCSKIGHFLYPCKDYVGQITKVPLSIPKEVIDNFETGFYMLNDKIFSYLPKRRDNSHKGDFGKALAYVGSDNMQGAALLSVSALFKSGIGMVTAASSESVLNNIVLNIPEAMTLPLYTENDEATLKEALAKNDVLLLGCGIGKSEHAKRLTETLITSSEKPMVIDADAINHLSENTDILYKKKAPAILTPHIMEFSRLTGLTKQQIEENKLKVAMDFAKKYDVILVLKNADTIVATPNGNVYICAMSNSGLATAGSGDVLAGIITGMLAQGASAEIAAASGVYLHSVSGRGARHNFGERSMTASDIISGLTEVLKKIN